MPAIAVILIVVVFVVMDSIIVWAVISSATSMIRSLTDKFPAMPATEPWVRREFSSVRMGLTKFDNSVHITIDREYLHVEPAAILRWMGVQAMSVKRTEIVIPEGEPRGIFGKGMQVQIGKTRMWFPAWCIEELRK